MNILESIACKPTQSQPYITGINVMRRRISTLRDPKIDVFKTRLYNKIFVRIIKTRN